MRLFRRKQATPIRVSVTVRAFLEGRMVRASLDAEATEGERLKDLLKRLAREGAVESSVVRQILQGAAGVTVLHNGERLSMPEAAGAPLAAGDQLSVLTPMAGG